MPDRDTTVTKSIRTESRQTSGVAKKPRNPRLLLAIKVFSVLLLVAVIGLATVLVWISPRFNPGRYEHLLFAPQPMTQKEYREPQALKPELVTIDSTDGIKLAGWYYSFSNGKTVLVSGGKGQNIKFLKDYVKVLRDSGAGSVLLYDYRGYGVSAGKPTLKGVCEDGLSAYDYLNNKRGIPASNIVLSGGSLGSGISCYIAEKRGYAGMIMECGFGSLKDRMHKLSPLFSIVPDFLFPEYGVDNRRALRGEHPPVIMLHGKKDDLFPYDQQKQFYESLAEPKRFVLFERLGHEPIWLVQRADYVREVGSFIRNLH